MLSRRRWSCFFDEYRRASESSISADEISLALLKVDREGAGPRRSTGTEAALLRAELNAADPVLPLAILLLLLMSYGLLLVLVELLLGLLSGCLWWSLV